METLRIKAGDLVIGSSGYDLISGQPKNIQDLGVILREPLGSDPYHPRWGSLLPSYIGGLPTSATQDRVRGEIQRLVTNYIAAQSDRITADATAGNPSRFTADEVIASIQDIVILPVGDRFNVTVKLRTLSARLIEVNTTAGG